MASEPTNRKSILFISASASPLGGIATWLDYIVPGLREQGWDVTLGLVEGRFHDVETYLSSHRDEQILRISCGTGTMEGRIRQLVRSICRLQPDVVVAVHIADVALAVNRIRENSGWSPHVVAANHALNADQIHTDGIYGEVYDAVICPNRLSCEMVARMTTISSDRIHYAPCGVDINEDVNKRAKSSDVLRLAYVGRLQRRHKRIEDLVAIVDELSQRHVAYEMVIAGEGPDEDWLRQQLSNHVDGGWVRFLGTLTQSELARQVYSCADGVLITSLWETGPLVAWEAMAHQVPVVTSAYIGSGLEDGLESGQNCLKFSIGDYVAATDCVLALQDINLKNKLAHGGMALVTERYSKSISIREWNSCLKKVSNKPQQSFSEWLAKEEDTAPAGRLDVVLGFRVGETIREWLGREYAHNSAGEEWPIARHSSKLTDANFWDLARSVDNRRIKVDELNYCQELGEC